MLERMLCQVKINDNDTFVAVDSDTSKMVGDAALSNVKINLSFSKKKS